SSLPAILNPDGSIRTNVSGSFDPSGYRLTHGPNGEPRFTSANEGDHLGCADSWDTSFYPNGADSYVNVIVPDGKGNIYFGGRFGSVQGLPANGIAKWDGTSWSALGDGAGLFGTVLDIAVSGTDVYMSGSFNISTA